MTSEEGVELLESPVVTAQAEPPPFCGGPVSRKEGNLDAYGVTPLLVETLVDERRFAGTCYRAANFVDVRVTAGRGRRDRHTQRRGAEPKRIFVYPLRRDSRRLRVGG